MRFLPDLIERRRSGRINGLQMMREMLAYQNWQIPVSEKAAREIMATNELPAVMFSQAPDGKKWLLVYGDAEAAGVHQKAVNDPQHYVTAPGTVVFQLPLDGFSQIIFDHASPHEVAIDGPMLQEMRKMAPAAEIEETLLRVRTGDNPPRNAMTRVRDYAGYILAVRKASGGLQVAMAPDEKGRSLAAVFTSNDNFNAYLDESGASPLVSEIWAVPMAGKALFEQLSKIQVDGLVFNCSGPSKAVAFVPEFSSVVLNG